MAIERQKWPAARRLESLFNEGTASCACEFVSLWFQKAASAASCFCTRLRMCFRSVFFTSRTACTAPELVLRMPIVSTMYHSSLARGVLNVLRTRPRFDEPFNGCQYHGKNGHDSESFYLLFSISYLLQGWGRNRSTFTSQ